MGQRKGANTIRLGPETAFFLQCCDISDSFNAEEQDNVRSTDIPSIVFAACELAKQIGTALRLFSGKRNARLDFVG